MNRKGIALALLILSTNFACAASFGCDKAGTKVEKMICADSELSKLDDEMKVVYANAQNKAKHPAALRQQHISWLKSRNNCVKMSS